jgi:hypothetical protein
VRRMVATLRPKSDMGKGSPVADDVVRLEGHEDTQMGSSVMGLKGKQKGGC